MDQYAQKYQTCIPRIDLIKVKYDYKQVDYTYLKNDQLDLPSQKDVENQFVLKI